MLLAGCSAKSPGIEERLLTLAGALQQSDAGAALVEVDLAYQDDIGGVGRLEDDLRQLLAVYGPLEWRWQDLQVDAAGGELRGHQTLLGRGLRFEGPMVLSGRRGGMGWTWTTGILTDLRSVIYTLRQRRLALENGQPERLGDQVSMDYQGPIGGRAELMERLRRDLTAARGTAMMVDELVVSVSGDRAIAIQSYLLVSQVGDRKVEHRSRERLELRKEGVRWRLVGGLG